MITEQYDVVVAGAGGMGSAALYHLARRGVRVCAVERFGIAHDRGSAHGDTRIIRKAYMEHPDYVPLLHRAYALWEELEAEEAGELFARVGLLVAGDPDAEAMQGQAACYQAHDLPHEELDAASIGARYPGLALPEEWSGFYDPLGGFLRVEDCVRRHVALARKHGAKLYDGEVMLSWRSEGEGVVVETERRRLLAARLVLATGAWAVPELCRLGVAACVVRKVQLWYQGRGVEQYARGCVPLLLHRRRRTVLLWFPRRSAVGPKIGRAQCVARPGS